jgi:hypothetical protein
MSMMSVLAFQKGSIAVAVRYTKSLVEPAELRSFICRDWSGEKEMDPTTFAGIIAATNTCHRWPRGLITSWSLCQADLLSGLNWPWMAGCSTRRSRYAMP